jgi:hypothetical protein
MEKIGSEIRYGKIGSVILLMVAEKWLPVANFINDDGD